MSSEARRKSVEASENVCTVTIKKLDDTGSSDGEGDDNLDKLDNNASTSFFTSGNKKIVLATKKSCASNKTPRQIKKNRKSSTQSRVIYASDCMVSSLVVGPMVVAHWRGIWVLMDFHENIFSGWLCFGFGMSLHLLFALLKQPLHRVFSDDTGTSDRRWTWRTIGCRLVRTAYTYVFSLACNCHWRGAWIVLNDWFGLQARIIGCFTLAVLGNLMLLRCLRNLLAPPFLVSLDSPKFVFRFPTRYNQNSRDWSLYMLDCAFSVGVIGTLVVFVWRGAWVLFDLYLYPDNREHSALGSLVLGYTIVVLTFGLQPAMRYVCAKLQGLARLAAADAFLLLSFVGTVNVWRGIWNVLDLWLLPEDPKLSCWITHLGCFVFLVLLNCSNSVLVRGVYIDAEEEAGKCVVFPCHYLRTFFKLERDKKLAAVKRKNLIVTSRDPSDPSPLKDKDIENGVLLNSGISVTIVSSTNVDPASMS